MWVHDGLQSADQWTFRNVDLRLLAKQYVLFAGSGQAVPAHLVHKDMPAELQEAVDQCELTGYVVVI